MGDRANCVVLQNTYNESPPVWIYTHWGGHALKQDVQAALARRLRWDDDSYLTRIIFDQMSKDQQGKETGFGITTQLTDNEHPIIYVDPKSQTVAEKTEKGELIKSWSFEEFIALDFGHTE